MLREGRGFCLERLLTRGNTRCGDAPYFQDLAQEIMSEFKWGKEFLRINKVRRHTQLMI
jgi:hypothetical protein